MLDSIIFDRNAHHVVSFFSNLSSIMSKFRTSLVRVKVSAANINGLGMRHRLLVESQT